MHDERVAAIVDDRGREQRSRLAATRVRAGSRRARSRTRAAPARAACRSASISAGDRKSAPEGSHAAGASRSPANQRSAASVHAAASSRRVGRAGIVERERESERAVRVQAHAAADSAAAAGSRDSGGRSRRPAAQVLRSSAAPCTSCARREFARQVRAATPSRTCARRNALPGARDTRTPADVVRRQVAIEDVADRHRAAAIRAMSRRTRASIQCMCTHECQSKLP